MRKKYLGFSVINIFYILSIISIIWINSVVTFAEELPLYQNKELEIDLRVEDLLARMSLPEKIGQMTMIERGAFSNLQDMVKYGIGSILSGGGSAPYPNNPANWVKMYNSFQEKALESRLSIPIIYGTDAVHGHNNVKGAVIFPHNIGLGASRDPQLVKEVGKITALEMAGTGIDWNFGPCLAVARDEHWGRTYESFSEDPKLVAELGQAKIAGLQGEDLADDKTILATAKHWVADGGTVGGLDRSNAVLSEETLRSIHIYPYLAAVEAGVGSVMISQSCWNGVEMHAQQYLINDVLKGEMGFSGIVLSDWEGIDQIPGNYRSDIKVAINAGIDMVMVPYRYKEFTSTLIKLVEKGEVPLQRIDDAVRRILTKKFELGLFEEPYCDESLTELIGCQEHRELARKAVRQSLVLLKNDDILPLSKSIKRIHLAGKLADDLGSQCGGWTITWQGKTGNITEGTTILEAVREMVGPETEVSYSIDGSGAAGSDVCIVVVGERPYAEWEGDQEYLYLPMIDDKVLKSVNKTGVPIVTILMSGRPLIINGELEKSNAFITAWLPGTEGSGIADVLFGNYSPSGKLPFSWPTEMEQIPINVGDEEYQPLFPYGFGLTYE